MINMTAKFVKFAIANVPNVKEPLLLAKDVNLVII